MIHIGEVRPRVPGIVTSQSRGVRMCKYLVPFALTAAFAITAAAQSLGQPDRASPGDEMIQAYLRAETAKIAARFSDDLASRQEWEAKRPRYVEEYFYTLGLSPRP